MNNSKSFEDDYELIFDKNITPNQILKKEIHKMLKEKQNSKNKGTKNKFLILVAATIAMILGISIFSLKKNDLSIINMFSAQKAIAATTKNLEARSKKFKYCETVTRTETSNNNKKIEPWNISNSKTIEDNEKNLLYVVESVGKNDNGVNYKTIRNEESSIPIVYTEATYSNGNIFPEGEPTLSIPVNLYSQINKQVISNLDKIFKDLVGESLTDIAESKQTSNSANTSYSTISIRDIEKTANKLGITTDFKSILPKNSPLFYNQVELTFLGENLSESNKGDLKQQLELDKIISENTLINDSLNSVEQSRLINLLNTSNKYSSKVLDNHMIQYYRTYTNNNLKETDSFIYDPKNELIVRYILTDKTANNVTTQTINLSQNCSNIKPKAIDNFMSSKATNKKATINVTKVYNSKS